MLIEVAKRLPVQHLSASSLNLWLKCRIRWKRRYIDNLIEPISPAALLGRAVGGAERDSYAHQVDTGRRLSTREVMDAFSDSWELALDREGDNVQWDEPRHRVKDSGARILPVYHQLVAPTVTPIAVERGFAIILPGVEWTIDGFLDVEADDEIPDLKVRSRSKGPVSREEADSDVQAGTYLAARRAEGNPVERFAFHNLVRQSKTSVPSPADVRVTYTLRTDDELDQLLRLYMATATEIAWRAEYDAWDAPPPPGAWWCSQGWCGFWDSCAFGGALRGDVVFAEPRPARRVSDSLLMEAVHATLRRSGPAKGTTTAEKVAAHLGIGVREAAGRLSASPRIEAVTPTKSGGRGKPKIVVRGPRWYAPAVPIEAQMQASLEASAAS